jgi:DNA-binding NarL/FixJ family response regulator
MRVVIGEDQVLMREGLSLVLERAGFTIEAAAEDAPGLVRRARALRPDLVVADIRMPPDHTDDGLRAVIKLRSQRPDLPVLVLSQHVDRRYAIELLAAGEQGTGYLLKERIADLKSFVADLHRIMDGGTVLDPLVVTTMMDRPRQGDPLADLTIRQREVLALMAAGRSNAAIAARLHVTEKSVARHSSNIYTVLGIDENPDEHRRVLAVARYLSA